MSSKTLLFSLCLGLLTLPSGEEIEAIEKFQSNSAGSTTFRDDVEFLQAHTDIIVLRHANDKSQLAVAPAWQGRVMTSTVDYESGRGFGWINRSLIASGQVAKHMNAYGGEDRLWLGPEGGQFSIYFAKDAPFDIDHWFVPEPLDTRPFKVVNRSPDWVSLQAQFALTNYSGTRLEVRVKREVRLLESKAAWGDLGLESPGHVSLVAYESRNALSNGGKTAWTKDTGMLSIWILGMFSPSPSATIVIPIKSGPESALGTKVTSNYFGSVPPDRLKLKNTAVFLRADGRFRSKVGISPRRSLGKLGSYDSDQHVLTIVQFNQPDGVTDYVNSLWQLQENPFSGDVANAYNDGPPAPGAKPLGPFFEMESSSPAAALPPGGEIEHTHRTLHLSGPEDELDTIARSVFGVPLREIQTAFDEK